MSEEYLLYSGFLGLYLILPMPEPEKPEELEEPIAVGGEVCILNKVNILLPWIVLALAVVAAGSLLDRRRVHD